MDSSTHFYLAEEVFYYTEALVLFCNANVNIFFSCINNVWECLRVCACMCDCVCGLDCVGALGLCLNRPASFYPNLLFYLTHHPKHYQREPGIKPTSQGLTMNVLKYIDSPHWWCFNYTTCFLSGRAVKGRSKAYSQWQTILELYYQMHQPHPLASLLCPCPTRTVFNLPCC